MKRELLVREEIFYAKGHLPEWIWGASERLGGWLGNCVLRREHKGQTQPSITNETLREEVVYARGKLDSWVRDANVHLDRKKNKEASQREGTGVACSCCFDKYAIEDMVSCKDEGHLFCCDCLKAFAENHMFGTGNLGIDSLTKKPALELTCFHGDGCRSGFTRAYLEKALPQNTLQKYDIMQSQIR